VCPCRACPFLPSMLPFAPLPAAAAAINPSIRRRGYIDDPGRVYELMYKQVGKD
jgi:hypothetical protein